MIFDFFLFFFIILLLLGGGLYALRKHIYTIYRKLHRNELIGIIAVILPLAGSVFFVLPFQFTTLKQSTSLVRNGLEKQDTANYLSEISNNINKTLLENSRLHAEYEMKKLKFDVINILYKDFYGFGNNAIVMKNIKSNTSVDDFDLGLYLNGFEDIYEQCKTGMLSIEDVRVNFQYLLNPICTNQNVNNFLKQRGNGLKILCRKFYPSSIVGNSAKLERNSCN